MKTITVLLLLAFSQCLYSQITDSLIERSLSHFDLPPYSGKVEPQNLRLGMYTQQVKPDSTINLPGYPKDLQAYKIWHILPHWSADEAGLYIGDTLIGMNGHKLYDSISVGDDYIELQLRDNKEGDIITVNMIKNGRIKDVRIKLIGLNIVDLPVIDPGLGETRKNSWLSREIDSFKIRDWTNEIQKQMATAGNSDFNKVPYSDHPLPWRLNAVTYLHHNPTRVGAYSRYIVDDLWKSLDSAENLSKLVRTAAKYLDIKTNVDNHPKLPVNIDELIAYLNKTDAKVKIAYKNIENIKETTNELMKILNMDSNWEEALDTISDPVLKKSERNKEEQKLAKLFRNANNMNFPELVEAGSDLAALIDTNWAMQFAGYLKQFKSSSKFVKVPGVTGDVLFYKETSFGKIVIGDIGDNKYTGDFAFIMDLGGNDSYELNPCDYGKLRFVLDINGNDTYINEKSGQASGIGCVDVLFDISGNDTYRSGYFSQGAALLGIGILADYAGDDIYTAHWCSQGAAFLGIGLLLDLKGNDNYFADVFSQAFGYVKGIGIIMEREGNDSYKAGWKVPDSRDPGRANLAMSQGFGYGMRPWTLGIHADGGIGVLTDYNGDDVYNSDFFSQGGSYWYALGILHDRKGCDRYTAGQYSQGSGIHLSFGALLDDEGKDMYDAYAGLEQGNAHDLSAGCLEDGGGNDTYRGYGSSQGSALTVAFAWLMDYGGNDMYICTPSDTALSEGGGRYNLPRKAGSLGILLDLGQGDDFYVEPRAVQGQAILKGRLGILFDDGKK